MHKYQAVIRLHHTDAAGVVYFANLFVLAHDCYESFLERHRSVGAIIGQGEFSVPIVHAEADYLLPLKLSEKIVVEMILSRISKTSFELNFTFLNQSSQVAARGKTSHVVVRNDTEKPVEIPQFLRNALDSLR